MVQNSNNYQVNLFLNNRWVAGGHEIDFNTEFSYANMGVTRGPTGSFREIIPTIRETSIQFNALFDISDEVQFDLLTSALTGDRVRIATGTTFQATILNGFVENVNINGGTDDVISVSFTVISTGEVEQAALAQLQALCINGETICIMGESLQTLTR